MDDNMKDDFSSDQKLNHIDNMQLLVYGEVASTEQIIGKDKKEIQEKERKRRKEEEDRKKAEEEAKSLKKNQAKIEKPPVPTIPSYSEPPVPIIYNQNYFQYLAALQMQMVVNQRMMYGRPFIPGPPVMPPTVTANPLINPVAAVVGA